MQPKGIITNDLYRIENKEKGYSNLFYYFWFPSYEDKKTKVKLIKRWEKEYNKDTGPAYKIVLDYTTLKQIMPENVGTGIPANNIQ